jgi:hypothetical protein
MTHKNTLDVVRQNNQLRGWRDFAEPSVFMVTMDDAIRRAVARLPVRRPLPVSSITILLIFKPYRIIRSTVDPQIPVRSVNSFTVQCPSSTTHCSIMATDMSAWRTRNVHCDAYRQLTLFRFWMPVRILQLFDMTTISQCFTQLCMAPPVQFYRGELLFAYERCSASTNSPLLRRSPTQWRLCAICVCTADHIPPTDGNIYRCTTRALTRAYSNFLRFYMFCPPPPKHLPLPTKWPSYMQNCKGAIHTIRYTY